MNSDSEISPKHAFILAQQEKCKDHVKCVICGGYMPQQRNMLNAIYIVCYGCPVSGMTPKEKRKWWDGELRRQRLTLVR